MTQPIQEPSTQRSLSQGRWGENQLFRRPAPPSGAEISVFRAYRTTAVSIGGAGTAVQFRWNIWENCDTDVFSVTEVGGALDTLNLLVAGRLVMQWGVQFASELDDSMGMYIEDGDPVFGPNVHMLVHGRCANGVNTFQLGDQIYVMTLSKSYPTLDIFSSGAQFPMEFRWLVAQLTGSAVNVTHAFLDVQYEPAEICVGPIDS